MAARIQTWVFVLAWPSILSTETSQPQKLDFEQYILEIQLYLARVTL